MSELNKLQKQIATLTSKAQALLEKEKAAAIDDIKKQISQYEITAKDLGLSTGQSSTRGVKVPIKYRKGSHAWSGRGRQPKWLVEHLKAGGKLSDVTA